MPLDTPHPTVLAGAIILQELHGAGSAQGRVWGQDLVVVRPALELALHQDLEEPKGDEYIDTARQSTS